MGLYSKTKLLLFIIVCIIFSIGLYFRFFSPSFFASPVETKPSPLVSQTDKQVDTSPSQITLLISLNTKPLDLTLTSATDPELIFDKFTNSTNLITTTGQSLQEILNDQKMGITGNCFTLDDDTQFCADDTNTLKIFINQQEVQNANYNLESHDQVLIYFGQNNSISINQTKEILSSQSCLEFPETCKTIATPTSS